MKNILTRLKNHWNLDSLWQVVIVMIVFACTGMSVLFIKKPLFLVLGVSDHLPGWQSTLIYLITVLPLYQLLLLGYGFIFGQFKFFWEFEKKTFRRIGKLVKKKQSPELDSKLSEDKEGN